jgi:hypothetical protein
MTGSSNATAMRNAKARADARVTWARFENLEALGRDAHVAELDLRTKSDYVGYLQRKLLGLEITNYVICYVWNIQ